MTSLAAAERRRSRRSMPPSSAAPISTPTSRATRSSTSRSRIGTGRSCTPSRPRLHRAWTTRPALSFEVDEEAVESSEVSPVSVVATDLSAVPVFGLK
eukprot:7218842-Prymnesium_polylepis.2